MKPSNAEIYNFFKQSGPKSIFGWILFFGILVYYLGIAVDLAIELNPMALICGLTVVLPIGALAYLSQWWSAFLLLPVIWVTGIPMYIACDATGGGHFNLLHLSHEYEWVPLSLAGIQLILALYGLFQAMVLKSNQGEVD